VVAIAAAIFIAAAEVTVAVLLPPSSQLPSPSCRRRRRAIAWRPLLLPCYRVVVTVPLHRCCCRAIATR